MVHIREGRILIAELVLNFTHERGLFRLLSLDALALWSVQVCIQARRGWIMPVTFAQLIAVDTT